MTFQRVFHSSVFWSWVSNGLRLLSGLILTSLLFSRLTTEEWGMSGVLTQIGALSVIFDFGFAPTVDRFVGYAMGGARTLIAHGVAQEAPEGKPNFTLVWELLLTTRRLYRFLTLVLLVVMGIVGSVVVENLIHSEAAPGLGFAREARLAWGVTLAAMLLDVYANWWTVFLRGLNQVRVAAMIASVGTLTKCLISSVLLLKGGALLSLPIGIFIGSAVQRGLARRACLRFLPAKAPGAPRVRNHLSAMWPNSWRAGTQLIGSYLVVPVNTFLCAKLYHLELAGEYTYSTTLMGYAFTMALVWTNTKWPIISQLQARRDYEGILRVLRPRIWLQGVTFLLLGAGVVFVAPSFLHWVGKDKNLLPLPWLLLLMLGSFMELQMNMFGALISTGNRWPFLWVGLFTNLGTIALTLILLKTTHLAAGAFVLAPLMSNAVFNYWYWPAVAARGVHTGLLRLLFGGSEKRPLETTQTLA